MQMASKNPPLTRHVVSINDLTNQEIESIFDIAQRYLDELGDPNLEYRIAQSTDVGSKFILATLFYEPSTRTRLSFESAMLRLGGEIVTSDDPAASSAKKGESLADTIRVISNYADVIVIRHPRDGAARLAAEYSPIPVINGGDGAHEHPTQTLCDLFTLTKKGKRADNNKKPRRLEGMKVAISGDLKGSRTIHSFVYALARFGAIIEPMPAAGMELPAHVDRRLREEFQSKIISKSGDDLSIDVLYVTSDKPHQQSLFSGPEVIDHGVAIQKKVDAVYVTRFQKERYSEDKKAPYLKIDAKFMKDAKYSDASVMHPLPRVDELDVDLDSDRRAVYFQQAAYGVPIRMALITMLLNLKNKSLQKFQDGFAKPAHLIYRQPIDRGVRCINKNCISHEPSEQQYVANKFFVVPDAPSHGFRLRCLYCETDIEETATRDFVVTDTTKHSYTRGLDTLNHASPEKLKHMVIRESEADAQKHGFRPHLGKVAKAS
jgi:aspartate carbamoyltransferase catalytic subunit